MKETSNEIIREMRRFADTDSQTIGRDVLRRRIQNYCDRIEEAWEREAKAIATENAVLPAVCITKMSGNPASMRDHLKFKFVNGFGIEFPTDIGSAPTEPIGNGAKMREALLRISDLSKTLLDRDYDEVNVNYLIQTEITSALSAPARNCDLYPTLSAALDAWREIDPREAGPFNEWLLDEAKGGAK